MLGTRGCRLGILYPEIYEMQVRAIMRAASRCSERGGDAPHLGDHDPADRLRARAGDPARARRAHRRRARPQRGRGLHGRDDDRAAARVLRRDRIAEHADFFSLRHERPHPDRARLLPRRRRVQFLPTYLERKIIDHSPFETIDGPGVGWLVRLAAWVGREANPVAQARHLRRARRRPGRRSTSSTWPGSTTSPAARSGSRSPASRPRRPRSATPTDAAGAAARWRARPAIAAGRKLRIEESAVGLGPLGVHRQAASKTSSRSVSVWLLDVLLPEAANVERSAADRFGSTFGALVVRNVAFPRAPTPRATFLHLHGV